jgi:hypothetical protein
MNIFRKYAAPPTMNPIDSARYINVNKIANSIEKANRVLIDLHSGASGRYNEEAVATWNRIIAALQMKWRDAMVEVQSNGHYSFE